MLYKIKAECRDNFHFGILSHHPAAIVAAYRAFGNGFNNWDYSKIMQDVQDIISKSPVRYVQESQPRGWFLDKDECKHHEHTGFYLYTDHWVDHSDSRIALGRLKKRITWNLGFLPEGCEFVAVIKSGEEGATPNFVQTKDIGPKYLYTEIK